MLRLKWRPATGAISFYTHFSDPHGLYSSTAMSATNHEAPYVLDDLGPSHRELECGDAGHSRAEGPKEQEDNTRLLAELSAKHAKHSCIAA